jgi:hypothetical protein
LAESIAYLDGYAAQIAAPIRTGANVTGLRLSAELPLDRAPVVRRARLASAATRRDGCSGLYFVGVHWLHKRKSSLRFGVGEDAEHVVSHLVARGD